MSGRDLKRDDSSEEGWTGLETAAALVLKQAVEMDTNQRYLEAVTCYREGIGILMDLLKALPQDSPKKQKMRDRVEGYMNRAEKLKVIVERSKLAGKFHEKIQIAAGSTGHSYERIFGSLIDDQLSHVDVEDPFIRQQHQLLNLVRFFELLVKRAPKLSTISLTTGQAENSDSKNFQEKSLSDLRQNLAQRNIVFEVHYSDTLHDREIRFNNGWIVKIGRGLDYFRPAPKFTIGSCDMELRPCHETTVDIFHRANIKHS